MLFDDEEQIEVRHVVSLAHHDISIYSGGDVTPEGELFIKRNALKLTRRRDGPEVGPDSRLSKPFYLFSEDSSAKEDFYFAMIRNQQQFFESDLNPPKPKQFDVKNIIGLVQKLHSSEEHQQTRWLNAIIGRVFLGLYRTSDLEHLIREKLTKKISRVKKPAFLSEVVIRKIHTGDSAPVLLNPRHKDLTIDGDCAMEADVRYNGNFRIEVAATARLDLGTRFKVREVNLVLAVVIRKLEGHVFFKIKPPPSNRAWISFQTMPKMEMDIEPIVSSRQITYTLILRQIESRIKEVIAETLVQPFWDDIPFFHTEHKQWRGGIWEGDDAVAATPDYTTKIAQEGDVDATEQIQNNKEAHEDELMPMEKSHSAPLADNVPPAGLFSRKLASKKSASTLAGTSTGAETKTPATSIPRPLRSPSVSSTTAPVTDTAHAEVFKPSTSPPDHASHMMAALSARNSPKQTPADSPRRPASVSQFPMQPSSGDSTDSDKELDKTPMPQPRRGTASSNESATNDEGATTPSSPSFRSSIRSNTGSIRSNAESISKGLFARANTAGSTNSGSSNGDPNHNKRNTLAAVANAATQARQWGWNALQKRREGFAGGNESEPLDLNKPMGRGRPLPPPGTPLPRPERGSKVTAIPVPQRKPVPAPALPDRHHSDESANSRGELNSEGDSAPPLPSRRRRESSNMDAGYEVENMLVVEAPMDSEPSTPLDDNVRDFNYPPHLRLGGEGDGTTTHASPLRAYQDSIPRAEVEEGNITGPEGLAKGLPDSPIEARPVESQEDKDDYSGWLDNSEDAGYEKADIMGTQPGRVNIETRS
jgi:hypothetical protein